MTNTAKILNFGRGNFAGQERNRPVNQQDACKRICGAIRAYTGIRYRAWR